MSFENLLNKSSNPEVLQRGAIIRLDLTSTCRNYDFFIMSVWRKHGEMKFNINDFTMYEDKIKTIHGL